MTDRTSAGPPADPAHGKKPIVIACAYPEGMLDSAWFRAYKRAKRTLKRGAFHARMELVPITDLPARVDVLLVPPALADAANAIAVVLERIVTSADAMQPQLDRLVERLSRDGRLPLAPLPARALAVHRGFQAVEERARLAE